MRDSITHHERGKDALYKTWHASEDHLFIYFHSNGGSIVSRDRVFPINQGSLVFIAANVYHYTMPDPPEEYDRSKLKISPTRLNKILELLSKDNKIKAFSQKAIIYSQIGEQDQREINDIFEVFSNARDDDELELLLVGGYLKLLLLLNKYVTESSTSVTGIMGKAIDYINKNITSDITIDNICSAINVSKYYFCRQFKKHTGLTVMNYILKTRIVLAKSELKQTNQSINEICRQTGFTSISYFCRVFKKEEHCTPLQYRKRKLPL